MFGRAITALLFATASALSILACGPADAPDAVEEAASELARAEEIAEGPPPTVGLDSVLLDRALQRADQLPRLRSMLVARHGEIESEEYYNGASSDRNANIKSASKSIISALVGIAISEGHLEGVDQPIAPFFDEYLGEDADPRKQEITIGDLLSMRSGLERTSGGNYGAWVSSSNWVRDAITRPMVAEPGGRMLYSTGNSHLLSAILTEATGMSTLAYARDRLGEPLGITIPPWLADPQGIYFGGNEMQLTPREMLSFGELYRNSGVYDGDRIVPEEWVEASWTPRTRSRWSGEEYGYGWFMREARGYPLYYAWGYGGQFIFIVPELELTVVTTSDPTASRGGDHLRTVHDIVDNAIIPAAETGARTLDRGTSES